MALYTGNAFDLAKFMTNLLFSTIDLGREKHISGWQFAGHGTELAARLGVSSSTENNALSKDEKPWSKPVYYLDEQAKYLVIFYYNIEHDDSLTEDEKFDAKHKANAMIIEAIQNLEPNGLKECFFLLNDNELPHARGAL